MEKRIGFFQFQSVKAVAKAIDPKLKEMETLKRKDAALKEEAEAKLKKLREEIEVKKRKLDAEFTACKTQIDALEAGIVQTLGFKVTELVKKVIEPTGKTDPKTGKPIKVTKYLPTDIVSYDEQAKEYVISMPTTEEINAQVDANLAEEQETVVPPATEDTAGSDYDKDAEALETQEEESEREAAEAEAEVKEELPWE